MESLTEQITTLETEVKEFANGIPHWAKYLCSEILSGNDITDEKIDAAFPYLLQDLKLIEKTEKPEILITFNPDASGDFKENIIFENLQNIEGVNALAEKQTIEFSPNLTIIYGATGAGKSGYIRLLKNAFYSKDNEDILENVNIETGHKDIYAEFTFTSDGENIPLKYPNDAGNGIFNQFAVFDGKIGKKHLSNRNDFSFRPAGLTLFAEFNSVLEKLQSKLSSEIQIRPVHNPFANDDIFQGESEIKTFLSSLSHNSKLEELKKHLPFVEDDQAEKTKTDKAFDDLKIALSQKEKSLKALRKIKTQLAARKKNLETTNLYFNQEYLDSIRSSISDCKTKQKTAKNEGVEKFKTDKLKNVGTPEWKQFIEAAEKFALSQKEENLLYPEIGDNCLLCQQPIIDEEPSNLIKSYWEYIKSVAEKDAKTAQEGLDKIKKGFEDLDLNHFPETDILTVWLKENNTETLEALTQMLTNQGTLKTNVIADISNKKATKSTSVQLDLTPINSIDNIIDNQIKMFEQDEQNKALAELLKKKTYLTHKEKLEQRITDIEKLCQNLVWVRKANNFHKSSWKSHSTNAEKRLSEKYFNTGYISTFNLECNNLNGNFGIYIDTKSSDGHSNRQLFLKGKNPSAVLSEGEQKVIALADFIAETNLSVINNGIIFDDPVTSLDEERKSIIAERLVTIAKDKQVIIFTHDLVFVSSLINHSVELDVQQECHWVESTGNEIGIIWLRNTPSYEKSYKKSGKAQSFYDKAKIAQPEEREINIKNGFAALRTSYEALVIFDLFEGVVQRFNERVSVDSLSSVYFDEQIRDEIIDSFSQCCRYMEGHSHSDKYGYKKPESDNLKEEIDRFIAVKKKIKKLKKAHNNG